MKERQLTVVEVTIRQRLSDAKKGNFIQMKTTERKLFLGEEKSSKWKHFFVIIDRLRSELLRRKKHTVASVFSVFCSFSSKSPSEISVLAAKLQASYKEDLEPSFANECVHFCDLLKCSKLDDTPLNMSKFIRKENLQQSFPNVHIALRMYLCTAISNCSAERSFSAPKRITTYFRSTLKQEILNSLAILHIEADILNDNEFEYNDLIDEFATKKSRRKCI